MKKGTNNLSQVFSILSTLFLHSAITVKSMVTQCAFTPGKYFCYDKNIILEDGTMVVLLF